MRERGITKAPEPRVTADPPGPEGKAAAALGVNRGAVVAMNPAANLNVKPQPIFAKDVYGK